ncbi:hypothetical protein J6590_017520 [Homalodisca vitripennis]|nr:hypothetical protein J6590_017520 [Homalodisca vitripennis]
MSGVHDIGSNSGKYRRLRPTLLIYNRAGCVRGARRVVLRLASIAHLQRGLKCYGGNSATKALGSHDQIGRQSMLIFPVNVLKSRLKFPSVTQGRDRESFIHDSCVDERRKAETQVLSCSIDNMSGVMKAASRENGPNLSGNRTRDLSVRESQPYPYVTAKVKVPRTTASGRTSLVNPIRPVYTFACKIWFVSLPFLGIQLRT